MLDKLLGLSTIRRDIQQRNWRAIGFVQFWQISKKTSFFLLQSIKWREMNEGSLNGRMGHELRGKNFGGSKGRRKGLFGALPLEYY